MLLCSTLPFVFVARHSFSFNSVIEQTSKLIMSSSCSSPSSSSNSTDPKLKTRIRRVKANGRERARMLGLNNALDVLREYIPITTQHQKLSKIETLRLAKNYIEALNRMLTTNSQPTPLEYAHQLANGLSQTTTNMLANLLQVQPRLLLPTSQFESFIDLPYSESTNSSPSNTTICSPQQYFYSSNLPSAAPLTTNPTIFDTAASSPTSTTSPHQRLQYPIHHHHHQQQQYFQQFSS